MQQQQQQREGLLAAAYTASLQQHAAFHRHGKQTNASSRQEQISSKAPLPSAEFSAENNGAVGSSKRGRQPSPREASEQPPCKAVAAREHLGGHLGSSSSSSSNALYKSVP
jgi:hypothetical protein